MKSAFDYLKALERRSASITRARTESPSTALIQPLLAQQRQTMVSGLRSGLLTAGLTTAAIFGGIAPANAADVVFGLETLSTGTSPFDANDTAGNDSSAGNNVIRTLDIITYRWTYAVNNGDSDNSVFTATLSPNHVIDSIPAVCQPGNIATAADGSQTLTCNVGTLPSGSTGFVDFDARVVTQEADGDFVLNGDTTTANATFSSDTAASSSDGPEENIVSAAPKVDLVKNSASIRGVVSDPNGVQGVITRYPLSMIVSGGGKGNESLQSPMSFQDNLSQHVPGTKLYDWGPHAGCGYLGQNSVFFGSRPYGIKDGTYADNRSVEDSGTWVCSQSAPGNPIDYTITGADTTGNHTPTNHYNGPGIPVTDSWLVSGWTEVWSPIQPILDAGGSFTVTNTADNFNATGVSGDPNQEPDFTNNSYEHTILAGNGSFTQYYVLRYQNRGSVMPGMSGLNGGDGPVMAGQNFAKRLYGKNTGLVDWTNYLYCEKFDNETHNVTQIPGQAAGEAVKTYNAGSYPFVIEYGIGGNGRTDTCDDADSTVGWHTSINDPAFGGSDNINKIRFRATGPMPPNSTMDVAVNFTARNNFLTSGAAIPVGTIFANYSGRKVDQLSSGNWYNGTYNPTDHSGTKAYGDRITFVRGVVRITKETVPNDTVNSVLAGGTVTFQLNPSVTAPIDPAPTNPDVTITDVLPAGLTYVAGSASLPPTSVTPNADGTTTIIWNLGPQVPNQALAPITFDAQVSPLVPNNTNLTNETVISSPEDGSPESVRDDDRTVKVGNPGAYGIDKDTTTPLIPLDNQMNFRLFMANLSAFDLGTAQFIDILPFNGDGSLAPNGRTPASNFTGTATFNSITGSGAGETFQFTNAPPTTINPDPSQNPGITWCAQPLFGTAGCPANNADVTAILIDAPAFPAGDPIREVNLVLDTLGNDKGQIYTNDFSGLPQGLGFIASPDATVRTDARRVDIELDKSVSDADGLVEVGDTITYTIDVVNNGPDDARLVEIADALPAGLTYVSDDANGAYDSNTGVWTVGPLAANGTAQLNITVTVTGTGTITNTAEVTKDDNNSDPTATEDTDSTPGNGDGNEDDQDSITITVTNPEIGVSKNAASVTGNQVTFDLVIENLGDVDLTEVTLTDDLDATFGAGNYSVAAPTIAVAPSAGSTVTANPGFNGSSDVNLIDPSTSALVVGETVTVQVVVTVNTFVDPDGPGPLGFAEYENQATTYGKSPTGSVVTDESDDGTDPDPDGDGNPGGPDETDSPEDDPTPVDFMIMPEIGVAKDVTSNVNNDDGTYTVTYSIVVENLGNIDLLNTQLTENLATTFTGATSFAFDSLSVVSGPVTANPAFDGNTNTDLLVGTDTLPVGGTATLELVVDVTPGSNDGPYNNTVVAEGETSPGGPTVTDDSDDGTDPDPDGDGNPGGGDETDSSEDDPTPVTFSENPEIGTAKQVSNVQNNADGSYTVTYAVAVENLGDVTLSNVQLTEDLSATFGASTVTLDNLTVTGGTATVTANPSFNGTSDTDLLVGTDSMAVGTNATLEFTVTVVPDDINATYNNTVVAEGTSPRGEDVTDNSDDGVDPDPDGDGNPGGGDETDSPEDDPTPISFSENPEIGTAKAATNVVNNEDGTYQITYAIAVENLGNVNLNNVQLTEDLATTFASATGFTVDSLSVTSGTVTANSAFNGGSDQNLLAGTDTMGLGETAELQLVVTVTPGVQSATYDNQIVAQGTSPAGENVTDDSDDGTEPDADGDGNAGGPDETDSPEDDPTSVSLSENPEIGTAKNVTSVTNNEDGSYEIKYAITVENLGNVNLSDVQLTEDLNVTFGAATSFTFNSLSVTSGPVTANPSFNGTSDTGLLVGTDPLNVGESATLELIVTVVPADVDNDVYNNQVVADGTSPAGTDVTDDSDDGTDPDPDGDGNPGGGDETDSSEDDPTPVSFSEDPEIGVAKRVVDSVSNRDGTYNVTYRIVVENLGDVNLNNVQLTEDLATTFAGATAFSVDSLSVVTGGVTTNAAFDGTGDTDLLSGSDSLAVGNSAELELVVVVTPGVPTATYDNTVVADATSPGGNDVTDDSDDGTDPDPDGDGDSSGSNNNDPSGNDTEDDPTPVTLTESPEIGVAKQVTTAVSNRDGTYTVTYAIAVENLGDVNLNNVQLTENLASTFAGATAFSVDSLSVTSGAVMANPNFDGSVDTDLLTGTDTMAVDATATLELVVIVTPGVPSATYENTVIADGTSPGGTGVTDDSDDGTDPDPDGDGDSSGSNNDDPSGNDTEDDPTPVTLTESPEIGVAKQVVSNANNADGTYTVTYDIVVENLGDVNLNDVQLTEDLATTFASASGFSFSSLTVTNGAVTANPNFDGSGDTNLLVGSDTMTVDETATLQLVVVVTPGANLGPYDNTVVADGTSPAGTPVTDDSDDGTDPDPDGDGDSSGSNTDDPTGEDTEDDPTPVEFSENPVIGTAKQVSNVANNTDGSYTVTYDIAVENLGDVNLNNVQLNEDLTITFADASSFTFDSLTVTSGSVTASSSFDGSGDIGLLAGSDSMAVGETATLQLVVTVMPAELDTTYNNQVNAVATSPAGESVTDASDNGTDPDPDGDGIPNGPNTNDPSGADSEDDPTPVSFAENAQIGAAKQVNNVVNNGDGTYDVTYDISVENLGDVQLNNVQLTENLAATFASATAFTPGALTVVSGDVTVNPNFNGVDDTNLLAGTDTIDLGETALLQLVVKVTPGAELGPYNNQVVADGTSPGGVGVSDDSDNGSEPDTDGDGVAGGPGESDSAEDDPTPVEFTENPVIGTAKSLASAVSNNDGTYTVTYEVKVQNLGDVNLSNVQLTEDLATTFAGAQAFAVQNTTVVSGPVTVNPNFNGSSDTNMLTGSDSMAVGDMASLTLEVLLTPGSNLGPYDNSITAAGVSPANASVQDLSDDGDNPGDQDGDGATGGEGEDDQTTLVLESNPNISLLKRITAVLSNDGTRTFSDPVLDSPEAEAIQAAGLSPVGIPEITTADPVFSGDILEYTIYFISDGNVPAAPVNLCDLVPTDTTFLADSFGASQGISVLLPGTATPQLQSNAPDADAGSFYSPLAPLPAGHVCSDPTNPNGAVLVNLQTVPNTPGSNAGFVRFRVRVN